MFVSVSVIFEALVNSVRSARLYYNRIMAQCPEFDTMKDLSVMLIVLQSKELELTFSKHVVLIITNPQ